MKSFSDTELLDLMKQVGASSVDEAQERLRLIREEKELFEAASLDVPLVPVFKETKERSPAAKRAQRYYERKRARQGKPYIPAAIRALGREEAERLGYSRWNCDVSPPAVQPPADERPTWLDSLSKEERKQLVRNRLVKGLPKHFRREQRDDRHIP